MLETIIIVLVILWLMGLVSGMAGNFIWLLLVVALVVLVIRLVTGRKVV